MHLKAPPRGYDIGVKPAEHQHEEDDENQQVALHPVAEVQRELREGGHFVDERPHKFHHLREQEENIKRNGSNECQ